MRYDKQNRRLAQRDAEIAELKEQNARLASEALHVKEIMPAV